MVDPQSAESGADPGRAELSGPKESAAGFLLAGRYELIHLLGSGSSGTVYKARDIILDRIVAAKILHKHLLSSPESLERFRQEALTTTSLDHQGIIQVFCHGVAEDGRPFMIMNYLEGRSLSTILRTEGCLSLPRFFNLFMQVAEALLHAHEKGVVHRDVKPSNIIIVREEEAEHPVIVDFGIARVLDQSLAQGCTATGVLLGSSSYMSPEQCRGEPVDTRSDIYSLGCVMFESLLGSAPFQGESQFDVMYRHLNESAGKLGKLKQLPAAVACILRKCLEKKTATRYQSLSELKRDLEACLKMQDKLLTGWSRLPPAFRFDVRLAAGTAVILLFGAIVFWISNSLHTGPGKLPARPSTEKSVDEITLPLAQDSIKKLLVSYSTAGKNDDCIRLAQRWEKKYMTGLRVTTGAKVAVLQTVIEVLIQQGKFARAKAYLERLKRLDSSPDSRLFVAARRARIFRYELQPQKGIEVVESTLSGLSTDSLEKIPCLEVQGDCYFDVGNVQKAAVLYLQAVELSKEFLGTHEWTTNIFRTKAIVALTELGRQAEADALLADCYTAVNTHYGRKLDKQILDRARAKDLLLKDSCLEGSSANNSAFQPADLFLTGLATECFERHNLTGYSKYCRLAIREFTANKAMSRAADLRRQLIYHLRAGGDWRSAINEAELLLQELAEGEFLTKLDWLVFIDSLYLEQNLLPQQNECVERAMKLISKELDKDPDLLVKQPSELYARLLGTVRSSSQLSPADLERRIGRFIDGCRGRDCLSLRCLYRLKYDCLVSSSKLDDAMTVARQNLDFFEKVNPPEPSMLSEWLKRKGDIFFRKNKFKEALQNHSQALSALQTLPGETEKDGRQSCLGRIARDQWRLGNVAEASRYYLLMEKEIGPDTYNSYKAVDGNAANDLLVFADFCSGRGDLAGADALINRVERADRAVFGDDCRQLMPVLYAKAGLRRQQGQVSESNKLFEKVIFLCRKYGVQDQMIEESQKALAEAGRTPAPWKSRKNKAAAKAPDRFNYATPKAKP
jgi:serine/threonine protein kinase/tetratricopeptide (TPR) repeat protein